MNAHPPVWATDLLRWLDPGLRMDRLPWTDRDVDLQLASTKCNGAGYVGRTRWVIWEEPNATNRYRRNIVMNVTKQCNIVGCSAKRCKCEEHSVCEVDPTHTLEPAELAKPRVALRLMQIGLRYSKSKEDWLRKQEDLASQVWLGEQAKMRDLDKEAHDAWGPRFARLMGANQRFAAGAPGKPAAGLTGWV